jgi:hypothetical protein
MTLVLVAVGLVAVAGIRELVRWRGRRWHGHGPRGDQQRPEQD